MKLLTLRNLAALAFACLFASAVQAAPITFNFTYSGAGLSPPNSTRITGYITFESTLLQNPTGATGEIDLPNPVVLALNVTVSGASVGNGSYGLSDFSYLYFATGTNGLDFSSQLVGQSEGSNSWGPFGNGVGDFNLFGKNYPAPSGEGPFYLCAGAQQVGSPSGAAPQQGEDNCAILTSMIQGPTPTTSPTPALSPWSLMLLTGLLGLAGFVGVRRYRTAR